MSQKFWQAEKTIEDFEPKYRDCLEAFVTMNGGRPCVVELETEKIPCILIGCYPHGHALLFVRRESNPTVMIIRITFIRSISIVR